MFREMRRVGLKPVPNFRLGPYTWDLGFEAGTTVVDLDSLYYHTPENNHREFLIGTWKTNHAVQHGWAPLKFTDECTDYHLKLVVIGAGDGGASPQRARVKEQAAEGASGAGDSGVEVSPEPALGPSQQGAIQQGAASSRARGRTTNRGGRRGRRARRGGLGRGRGYRREGGRR